MLMRNHASRALILSLIVAGAAAAGPAYAQSSLGIGSAEPIVQTGGFFGRLLAWINSEQQQFYRALSEALKAMRENPWQAWSLVGLSFAYGVFHAAGPGHGKAVISSYMIANEIAVKRGIVLAFISSFLQGLVAILVVGTTYLVLRGTSISMTDATATLEKASYALIVAFGAWLLWKKLSSLDIFAEPVPKPDADHHHHQHKDHDHNHDHDHAHGPGDVCPTCGHSHMPDPALISQERLSLKEAWMAVAAVGLRPCSGAIIVLAFALLNGLYLAGILSVIAMSVGTAITVSTLASIAVGAKGFAVRLAGNSRGAVVGNTIEIGGALLVIVLGILLLGASFNA